MELLLLGLCLLWFTRRQRTGKIVVTLGFLWLVAVSNTFVAERLASALESRYPAYVVSASAPSANAGPSYIAVLGGWANDDPNLPISSHISPGLLARLVEGIRLHREIPGSKLVLSGYSGSAENMAALARALGVDTQDILTTPEPRDTEEEAHRISALAGPAPLVLVTSAAHMPRAMALFHKVGAHPHPAPTDYMVFEHKRTPDEYFPGAEHLGITETAFYEYLGLAWAKLRGKI
jgi:uncharacterized SAM-binding protein YcdF (DUF218 family)